ncbi:MAG TPA: RNA ligase family protein [Chthonomonadaceae bacterium]|nr:RNA ligase family protein [Chthonomonadaceae bacterium]
MNDRILKYPRTHHIEGSGIQAGDESLDVVSFGSLLGRHLVIEEKMDGANCAISFSEDGRLLLQSRGHYLTGGERERQFHLFKTWAYRFQGEFREVLADRYILYGEWLYAKHTVFYTDLPHYFLEFDIFDRETETFLDTVRRREFLRALPFVVSVKVPYAGGVAKPEDLTGWIGPSYFIGDDHILRLKLACEARGMSFEQTLKETDNSRLMEGLYVKVEEEGIVQGRLKYVRSGFLQAVFDSQSHWIDRPLLPNELAPGVNLF